MNERSALRENQFEKKWCVGGTSLSSTRRLFAGMIGAVKGISRRVSGAPIGALANVALARGFSRAAGWRWVRHGTDFPPALSPVIVLVIDDVSGPFEQRPNPAHAMVAVIRIVSKPVS